MAAYAHERFPERLVRTEDAELLKLISRVRLTANGYGLTREQHVANFLDMTLMYGEQFHTAPWAAAVIQSNEMSEDCKLSILKGLIAMTGVDF